MSSLEIAPIVTEEHVRMVKDIAAYHGTILQGGSYHPTQHMAYTRFCTGCNRLSDALNRPTPRNHVGCIYYWLQNTKVIGEYRGKTQFGRMPEFIAELQRLGCVFPASYAAAGLPVGRHSPTALVAASLASLAPTQLAGSAAAAAAYVAPGGSPTPGFAGPGFAATAPPASAAGYPSWGQTSAQPASAQPAGFAATPSWGQATAPASSGYPASCVGAAAATSAAAYPSWGQTTAPAPAGYPASCVGVAGAASAVDISKMTDAELAQYTAYSEDDEDPEDEEDNDDAQDDDDDDDDKSSTDTDDLGYNPHDSEASDDGVDDDDDD